MKLNKSLISLAVLVALLATSCSQARYGSLTRRTKANHTAQQKTSKQKLNKKTIEVEHAPALTQGKEELVEKTIVETEETKAEKTVFTTRNIEKKDVLARFMATDEKDKQAIVKTTSAEPQYELPVLAKKRLNKKIQQITENTKLDETQDLVRLLIIIILVLLILALLPPLGGLIRGLISLIILILLIWLLLQIL